MAEPKNGVSADQRVTNATLLLEIRHLGEKIDQHALDEAEYKKDHETRLRTLEESNTVSRTLLSVWSGLNTIGAVVSLALGLKP